MAVEILILTGARQGVRLALDGKQFRVGTGPECDVFFDPQQDPSAKGRAALLQLEDDGWHIRSTGTGELMVNQEAVTGPKCLRSGDVVRLSPIGPGFSFRLMVPATEGPREPLELTRHPSELAEQVGPPPTVAARQEAKTPEAIVAPPRATSAVSPPPIAPRALIHGSKWVLAGLGACLVMALLWRILQPQPTPHLVQVGGKSAESGKGDEKGGNPEPKSIPSDPKPSGASVVTPPPVPDPPQLPPPENLLEKLRDAVFLVEVEKAGRFWPFATCVAVGKQTLLTRRERP